MNRDRSSEAARLTRRTLLGAGLAAALVPEALAADDKTAARTSLQAYDKVEPQKYPWGWIRWLMNDQIDPAAEMTLGIVQIEPGQSNPLHIHPNCAELLHVLAGSMEHRIGDAWVTIKAGDTLRVPQNVVHMGRTGKGACRVLVVYNTGARQMVSVEEPKR